jgi:hypothetical protein
MLGLPGHARLDVILRRITPPYSSANRHLLPGGTNLTRGGKESHRRRC